MIKYDLNNRVAVVTGGAQGFGLAVTERFIDAGAKVVIWDIDEEAINIKDHEPSEFFFSHWTESKFPILLTSKTTFEVPFSLIHEPNFEAVKFKSKLGLEANPEKKLPEAAAPFALK